MPESGRLDSHTGGLDAQTPGFVDRRHQLYRLARDRVTAAAGRCVQEAAALSVVLGYRPQEARTAQKAGAA